MSSDDYMQQQINQMRKEIAALKENRVTYRDATVTAVDAANSSYTADVDGAGVVSGIHAQAGALPAIGDIVSLPLAGGAPAYMPPLRTTADPATGKQTSNVTEEGIASFQRVESVEDPVFQGKPLSQIAGQGAKMTGFGQVARAQLLGIGTGEVGVKEISFTPQAGRAYFIHASNLNMTGTVEHDDVWMAVRYTTDGSKPLVSSPILAGHYYDNVPAPTRFKHYGFSGFLMGVPSTAGTQPVHRLLWTVARGAGGSGTLEIVNLTQPQMMVWDIGANVVSTGIVNDGLAGTTVAMTRKVNVYNATWSATYNGSNAFVSSPDARQGQDPNASSLGNARSLIGFPDLTADLAGVTDDKIEFIGLELYANYWYYSTGGTGIFGYHGHTSQPGTFSGTTSQFSYSGWGRNRKILLNLTNLTGLKAALRTGSTRGFTVGPGPSTNAVYAGRFNGFGAADSLGGPPKLHITYYK